MNFMNRIRATSVRAALLALVASGASAQVSSQEVDSLLRALDDPRLLDALDVRAQIDEGVPALDIVVTLERDQAMRGFREWDDGAKARRHRAGVTTLQRSVLDTLQPAEFQGTRFLENVPVFAGQASVSGLVKLLADPRVASVELDRQVAAHTAQGISLMNATGARNAFDGSRVSIAIVDTGIDYTHESLGGGGFPNAKVIGGWDFGDNTPDPMDENGHGTSAAGVAAGEGPYLIEYIGGVAPGARLYALKIVAGGASTAPGSNIMAAWDWCVTHKNDDPVHPILVVNTSFGGGMHTSPCSGGGYAASAAALKSAGIMNFASAGNDGFCAALGSPACYTDVISVGAVYDANLGSQAWCISPSSCIAGSSSGCTTTGSSCTDAATAAGQVTCYSNSASFLDLLAPSTQAIVPALHGNLGLPGTLGFFGGTSAASPYAAGAAAILLDMHRATGRVITPQGLLSYFKVTGNLTLDPKSGLQAPRVNVGAVFTLYADVWVDFAHVGPETGAVEAPFNTLAEAVAAAQFGWQIQVKAGTTLETPVTIANFVRISSWGGVAKIGP